MLWGQGSHLTWGDYLWQMPLVICPSSHCMVRLWGAGNEHTKGTEHNADCSAVGHDTCESGVHLWETCCLHTKTKLNMV
jgi:hypothetical protein